MPLIIRDLSTDFVDQLAPTSTEFDDLRPPRQARVHIRRGTVEDFPAIQRLVGRHIDGPVASPDAVQELIAVNPNNLLVIGRGTEVLGVWAMMILNARGLEAMMSGEFDPKNPCVAHLAEVAEAPAAIYVALIICPGIAAEGICHVAAFLRQPLYKATNLFSRPTTASGTRINLKRGFRPVGSSGLRLLRYVRKINKYSQMQSAA